MGLFQNNLFQSRTPSPIFAPPISQVELERKQAAAETPPEKDVKDRRILSPEEEQRLRSIDDQKITFKHTSSKYYQGLDISLFSTKEFVQDLVKELCSLLENPDEEALVQGRYVGRIAIENYEDYNDIDLCFECKKLEKPKEFVKILDTIFIKLIAARLPESLKKEKTDEDLAQIIRSHYLDRFRRCPPPNHYMYTLSLPGTSLKGSIDLCFIQKKTYRQGAAVSDFLKAAYLAPKPYLVASHGFSVEECIDHLRRRIYAFCFKVADVHAALWRYLCKVGQGNLVLFSKDEDLDKLLASFLKPYPVELMAIKLETLDGKPFPQDEEGQKRWQTAHEVFEQFRRDFKNHLEKHASNRQGASFALLNLLQSLSRLKGLKFKEREIYFRSLSYILEVLPGNHRDPLAKFLKSQSEDVSLLLDFIQGAFLFEWMKTGKEKGISAYRFDFAMEDEPRFQICVEGHFLAVDASPDKLALQFLRAWTTLEQKFKNSPEKSEIFQGILKGLGITSLEFSPEQRSQVSEAILKNFESSPVIEVLENQFKGNVSLESFYLGLVAHVTDHSYLQKKILRCQLQKAKKLVRNSLEEGLLEQCQELIEKGVSSERLENMITLLGKYNALSKFPKEQTAAQDSAAADNSKKTALLFYQDLLHASFQQIIKAIFANPTPQLLFQLQLLISSAIEAKIFVEGARKENHEAIHESYLKISCSGIENAQQLIEQLKQWTGSKPSLELIKHSYFCFFALLNKEVKLSDPMKADLSLIFRLFTQRACEDNDFPLFTQFCQLVVFPFLKQNSIASEEGQMLLEYALHQAKKSLRKQENPVFSKELLKRLSGQQVLSTQLFHRIVSEMTAALAQESSQNVRLFKCLLTIIPALISFSKGPISETLEKLEQLNLSKRDAQVVDAWMSFLKLAQVPCNKVLTEHQELFCLPSTKITLLEFYIENQAWNEACDFLFQHSFPSNHAEKLMSIVSSLLIVFSGPQDAQDMLKVEKLADFLLKLIDQLKQQDQQQVKQQDQQQSRLLKNAILLLFENGKTQESIEFFKRGDRLGLFKYFERGELLFKFIKAALDAKTLPEISLVQSFVALPFEYEKVAIQSPLVKTIFCLLLRFMQAYKGRDSSQLLKTLGIPQGSLFWGKILLILPQKEDLEELIEEDTKELCLKLTEIINPVFSPCPSLEVSILTSLFFQALDLHLLTESQSHDFLYGLIHLYSVDIPVDPLNNRITKPCEIDPALYNHLFSVRYESEALHNKLLLLRQHILVLYLQNYPLSRSTEHLDMIVRGIEATLHQITPQDHSKKAFQAISLSFVKNFPKEYLKFSQNESELANMLTYICKLNFTSSSSQDEFDEFCEGLVNHGEDHHLKITAIWSFLLLSKRDIVWAFILNNAHKNPNLRLDIRSKLIDEKILSVMPKNKKDSLYQGALNYCIEMLNQQKNLKERQQWVEAFQTLFWEGKELMSDKVQTRCFEHIEEMMDDHNLLILARIHKEYLSKIPSHRRIVPSDPPRFQELALPNQAKQDTRGYILCVDLVKLYKELIQSLKRDDDLQAIEKNAKAFLKAFSGSYTEEIDSYPGQAMRRYHQVCLRDIIFDLLDNLLKDRRYFYIAACFIQAIKQVRAISFDTPGRGFYSYHLQELNDRPFDTDRLNEDQKIDYLACKKLCNLDLKLAIRLIQQSHDETMLKMGMHSFARAFDRIRAISDKMNSFPEEIFLFVRDAFMVYGEILNAVMINRLNHCDPEIFRFLLEQDPVYSKLFTRLDHLDSLHTYVKLKLQFQANKQFYFINIFFTMTCYSFFLMRVKALAGDHPIQSYLNEYEAEVERQLYESEYLSRFNGDKTKNYIVKIFLNFMSRLNEKGIETYLRYAEKIHNEAGAWGLQLYEQCIRSQFFSDPVKLERRIVERRVVAVLANYANFLGEEERDNYLAQLCGVFARSNGLTYVAEDRPSLSLLFKQLEERIKKLSVMEDRLTWRRSFSVIALGMRNALYLQPLLVPAELIATLWKRCRPGK